MNATVGQKRYPIGKPVLTGDRRLIRLKKLLKYEVDIVRPSPRLLLN